MLREYDYSNPFSIFKEVFVKKYCLVILSFV